MDSVGTLPNLAEFDSVGSGDITAGRMAADEKSYKYCYWRKADGTITVAPSWPTAWVDQTKGGWESLERYGQFLMTNVNEATNETWRVNGEPFRLLFQRGGAKEFTVAEIIEHQWHIRPPYQGVTFPQLAGVVLPEPVQCKQCPGKRYFNSADELTHHELIVHKDASQNQQLARNLADANAGSADAMVKALEMLAAQQAKSDTILAALVARLLPSDGGSVAEEPKGKASK